MESDLNNVISIATHEAEAPGNEDLAAIAKLVNQCWHEAYDPHLPDAICAERTDASFIRELTRLMARATIVRKGNNIVGYSSSVSNCIEHLWVEKQYRRIGIGSSLLEAQLDLLRRNGYQSAQAGCESFNKNAIAFYNDHDWHYP
jgi:GNAT superfamily N-acetyltransferase